MPTRAWRRHQFKARHYATSAEDIFVSDEVRQARNDFPAFMAYISGHRIAHCHMEEWVSHWVTGRSNHVLNMVAGPNISILSPRGAAKSTVISYLVAWIIGHNPAIPIIYLSYKTDIALSRSRIIKRILQTPKYQEVFPHIRPNKKKFNDGEWEIDKQFAGVSNLEQDYTLYAVGIDGGIVSKRSWLIVVDDPIKSRESIESGDIREKISNNWRDAAKPTLVPGGRMLAIGTRFRADDLHASDFTEQNGWTVVEQEAILTDNEGQEFSYWEARFPYRSQFNDHGDEIEGLYEMREKDPISFSFQYQNKVAKSSDISIDPAWIRYTDILPKEPESIGIGLDLSGMSKERRDYTAMVMGALNKHRVDDIRKKEKESIIILEAVRGRWPGNLDKIDKLIEMCVEWGVIYQTNSESQPYIPNENLSLTVFAEAVQYQVSFQHDWKRIVDNKYQLWNLRCKPVKVRGDKDLRLKSITGVFQDGLIEFNKYRDMTRLITELTQHGATDHDDLQDAFVHLVRGMIKYQPLSSED
jgi:hypothetical protein